MILSGTSSRSYAALQLLYTCGAIVGLFSLLALVRTGSDGSISGRITTYSSLLGKTKDVDRYSWHQCIGGSEYDNSGNWIGTYAAMQRKCHFKNVCVRLLPYANDAQGPPNDRMNNETIEMTYFQPPALIGGPRIWSTSQNDGDAWLKTDRDHFLRKVNAYEPMPTDVRYVTEPTVVSGSFWPHNYGHAVGDDLYPSFRLLRQFDLVRSDNHYVYHQSCEERGGWIGCRNAEELHRAVTSKPYQKLGGELFPDLETTTCFADVVMGTSQLSMRHVDERAWPEMVDHMKRITLPKRKKVQKHKVVVIEKHGRRTWLNYPEVREHIEAKYGVETLLLNPADYTVAEQLALFDETTVLVTPPGGVSFSSPFLRKSAVAIYVEWWSEEHGRSFPMDQEVYTGNPDVHPLFYPLARPELSLNWTDPGIDRTRFTDAQIWQGWSNVTISLPRLDLYLRSAFAHASAGMQIPLPRSIEL